MVSLGILCPGQGSQHAEMFDILVGHAKAARALDEAAKVSGVEFREAVKGVEDIFANGFAQPLLCAAQLATWAALREAVPKPVVFAGYSVGELAAYGCADALSVAETVRLAQRRAELMAAASPSDCSLLAVTGVDRAAAETWRRKFELEIAIINGPEHFILGGPMTALSQAARAAQEAGGRSVPLKVEIPAHTSLLDGAVEEFESELRKAAFARPAAPVVAGINACAVREPDAAIGTLAAQLARPINWSACMETAVEMGVTLFLELGPGASLARMVREAYPHLGARSVAEFRSVKGIVEWIDRQRV